MIGAAPFFLGGVGSPVCAGGLCIRPLQERCDGLALFLGGFGPGIDVRGHVGHQRLIAQHRPQCRRVGVVAGSGLCHRGQPRPPRAGLGGAGCWVGWGCGVRLVGVVAALLGCRGVWGRRAGAGGCGARWGGGCGGGRVITSFRPGRHLIGRRSTGGLVTVCGCSSRRWCDCGWLDWGCVRG
jgi:hypothetical protein